MRLSTLQPTLASSFRAGRVRARSVRPDDGLVAQHPGLDERAPAVADCLLPSQSALGGDHLDVAVTRCRHARGGDLADHSGSAGRNDHAGRGSPIGNGPVDRIAVIRAVRQDDGDRGRNLIKQRANQRGVALLGRGQGRSENLAGVRIDGQVQLAPAPPIAAAMLGHPPFTGAENLQAGAVDHHGDRTSRHGQGGDQGQRGAAAR